MEKDAKASTKNPGRKITRVREMLGVKQDVLANKMGITQQAMSRLELADNVDDTTIERAAKALGVETETIKNFNEEAAINLVQNNYEGSNRGATFGLQQQNHNCTFNPFDKYIEAVEKNEQLYESLLKTEREKIALLEKMLKMKK